MKNHVSFNIYGKLHDLQMNSKWGFLQRNAALSFYIIILKVQLKKNSCTQVRTWPSSSSAQHFNDTTHSISLLERPEVVTRGTMPCHEYPIGVNSRLTYFVLYNIYPTSNMETSLEQRGEHVCVHFDSPAPSFIKVPSAEAQADKKKLCLVFVGIGF